MSSTLSKAAIDRAGKHLRDDAIPRPEDVAIYNEYRASLADRLAEVKAVVESVGVEREEDVAARLKRLESVVAKLRRQPTLKLSAIQDIAGCRVIVQGLSAQDVIVEKLTKAFPGCRVMDRRVQANNSGYRAVHLVVKTEDRRSVEIQVRTLAQHDWALFSEQLADHANVGMNIKYGGGPLMIRAALMKMSVLGEQAERLLDDADRESAVAATLSLDALGDAVVRGAGRVEEAKVLVRQIIATGEAILEMADSYPGD
jgi:ppGpp synthetase/RelA/SpoT-type nucleotidyltranferase